MSLAPHVAKSVKDEIDRLEGVAAKLTEEAAGATATVAKLKADVADGEITPEHQAELEALSIRLGGLLR
jgi:hypothetical protein